MADFPAITHTTLVSLFSDIASAIRAKKGISAEIIADEFPSEIMSIPSGGITPSGTISITENDTYDVTQYAEAVVNVSGGAEPTLPAEYQEVAYIYTTGTQYIVTGYTPLIGDEFEYRYACRGASGALYSAGTGTHQIILLKKDLGYFRWFTTGYATNGVGGPSWDASTEIVRPDGGLWLSKQLSINGGEIDKPKGAVNTQLHLFVRATLEDALAANLVYFRVKRNGNYIFYGIPCYRKSDEVVGLFDAANNIFYTNDGTGVFTAGADVN